MGALAITKQVLNNGNQSYRATYNFQGDGTSTITGYVAADPTSSGDMGVIIAGATYYPGTHLKIWKIHYNLAVGFAVRIIWDATTAQDAWTVYGFGKQDFMREGGLYVPQSGGAPITGATGKILFSADPAAPPANTSGSIELWLKKDIVQ